MSFVTHPRNKSSPCPRSLPVQRITVLYDMRYILKKSKIFMSEFTQGWLLYSPISMNCQLKRPSIFQSLMTSDLRLNAILRVFEIILSPDRAG